MRTGSTFDYAEPALVAGLDRLAQDIGRWSAETGTAVHVDWYELVTARAALFGPGSASRVSANGSCRLLCGPGGWVAVNLARPEDVDAVAAIVEGDVHGDPWLALEEALARTSATSLVARARLLGVPAAPLGPGPLRSGGKPWSAEQLWPRRRQALAGLRVVDLSSMWAGPLAAKLLARAGADVVKVETRSRPDGARATPSFYATLHADDQHVVRLDFESAEGRRHLHELIDGADLVVESSRPRALEQLGCGPDMMTARPGKVWISITGYGRAAPGRDWVAFGDDAAVAGGLVSWDDRGDPAFCGDAVADPVTGMMAAAAALEAVAGGGGMLLDVPMARCAATLVA